VRALLPGVARPKDGLPTPFVSPESDVDPATPERDGRIVPRGGIHTCPVVRPCNIEERVKGTGWIVPSGTIINRLPHSFLVLERGQRRASGPPGPSALAAGQAAAIARAPAVRRNPCRSMPAFSAMPVRPRPYYEIRAAPSLPRPLGEPNRS
jgi:hypothetical protein